MMIDSPYQNQLTTFGWALALLGLAYAAIVATGAQIPRLVFLIPPLGLGAILCGAFGPRRSDLWGLFGIVLVAGYLLVRGGISPVWDLARRDLFLITGAVLAYLSASSGLRTKSGRMLFLGVVILLVFGNAGVALYQWQVDQSYAFLSSPRADTLGVSGFYYHRNYLAGFLEIVCPILIAVLMSRTRWFERLIILGPLLVCVSMCFLSNSRGGFGVMLLAGFVTGLMEHFRGTVRTKGSVNWRLIKVGAMFLGLLVLLLGGRYLWLVILENRGGSNSTAGSLGGRLGLAGVAFDIWLESPLWGMGAESYSYLYPKFFAGLGGWLGDAEMAHSDYMQLLTDYGLMGLLGVVFLIISIFFVLCRSVDLQAAGGEEAESSQNGGLWLRSAAVGAMVAEVLRATIDFNLHIAPNLILFAMVVAGGVSCNRRYSQEGVDSGRPPLRFARSSRVFALLFALGAGGYGLRAGWNEILAAPDWVAIEIGDDSASLRDYSEKAPSFEVLRAVAHGSLSDALYGSSETGVGFQDAAEDWRRALERHPLDGESLANYARCLDELKRFEEAEDYHLKALAAVSRRENYYGVIYGVGWHLLKRGNEALAKRRSGEALYLYEQAAEAFRESRERNFSRKALNRAARQRIEELIEFLAGARIEPVAVPTLNWQLEIE